MTLNVYETLNEMQSPYRAIDALIRARVRRIVQGKAFFSLPDDAKLFLHLVPVSDQLFVIDKRSAAVRDQIRNLSLLFGGYPSYQRINVDGYFASSAPLNGNPIPSFYQVYWDGSIEYGATLSFSRRSAKEDEVKTLFFPDLESRIMQTLQASMRILQQLQVPLPLRVFVSLMDAVGCQLTAQWYAFPEDHAVDRNELCFKPVICDSWDADQGVVMRPIFDALWNAGNFQFSGSYTETGEWKPRIQ
jgi:hypothetical protein